MALLEKSTTSGEPMDGYEALLREFQGRHSADAVLRCLARSRQRLLDARVDPDAGRRAEELARAVLHHPASGPR